MATKESDVNNRMLDDNEVDQILSKSLRFEHRQRVEKVDACKSKKLFLSFSLDGLIKIWKQNGDTLIDILLDNTLSACCFLNASGDLIVGWKSHLFKISMEKVKPLPLDSHVSSRDCDECDEFEEVSDDGSIVYENPALDLDEFDENTIKIDLKNYLVSFHILIVILRLIIFK